MTELKANIDDMTGEDLGFAVEHLLAIMGKIFGRRGFFVMRFPQRPGGPPPGGPSPPARRLTMLQSWASPQLPTLLAATLSATTLYFELLVCVVGRTKEIVLKAITACQIGALCRISVLKCVIIV